MIEWYKVNAMEKKVSDFIAKHNLILRQPVICATSGGVDSACLLHILHLLGYSVVLAHVNHHKRAESQTEQLAMERLAGELGIPFELLDYYYTGNDNFHNDSHYARYAFFKELCRKYNTDTIATAHHLDDQIETVLIKLMEGSNLYGYGGISICNTDGKYRIIRPLLCVDKTELYAYAHQHSLVYFEDSSNAENDFLRNRLRHYVIPLLKRECSDLPNKISQYSIQVKEAFQYIRKQSIDYLNQTNNSIDLNSFRPLDIAVQKDILSLLLERLDLRRSNKILADMLAVLESDNGTKAIMLEKGYSFVREYGRAYAEKAIRQNPAEITVSPEETGIYRDKFKFYFSKKIPINNAKYIKLCYNSLELPFVIRSKNDGDYITLKIGNKKVSRVFIDDKIPKNRREEIPVITDRLGNILWIYDLAKSKEVYNQKNSGDIYFVCEEIQYA